MRTEFEREFDRIRGLHAEVQVDFNVGRPCHPFLHFDVGTPTPGEGIFAWMPRYLEAVGLATKSPSDSVAEEPFHHPKCGVADGRPLGRGACFCLAISGYRDWLCDHHPEAQWLSDEVTG